MDKPIMPGFRKDNHEVIAKEKRERTPSDRPNTYVNGGFKKRPESIEKDGLAGRKSPELTVPARKHPETFVVRMFANADSRLALVRTLRKRIEQLEEEVGAVSLAKQMMCARAVWLATWLETVEVNAIEQGKFNPGPYAMALNALTSILSKLGLEKRVKEVEDLATIISSSRNGKKKVRE